MSTGNIPTYNQKNWSFSMLFYFLIGLAATSLISLVIFFFSLYYLNQYNQRNLDATLVKQQWNRFEIVLSYMAEDIMQKTKDYSTWDDTCKYLQENDKKWFRTEVAEWLEGIFHYNLFLLFNSNGSLFFYYPDDLIKRLNLEEVNPAIKRAIKGQYSAGLVTMKNGIYLIGVAPVYPSNGNGPPRGVFIFGRQMDATFLNDISRRIGGELILFDRGKTTCSKNFNLNLDKKTYLAMSDAVKKSKPYLQYSNGQYLLYFDKLKNLEKKPVAALGTVITSRNTFIDFPQIKYLLFFVLILCLVLATMVAWLLVKIVISPIIKLEQEITKTKDFNKFFPIQTTGPKEVKNLVLSYNKMTQTLHNQAEALEKAAITDDLTGLYNRRYLLKKMEDEVSRSAREGYSLALIFLDIDNLKRINDKYGHLAGDQVIKRIGEAIKLDTRLGDISGRLAGDEFLIITPQAGKGEAEKIIERITIRLSKEEITFNGTDFLKLKISFGLAIYPDDGMNTEELIKVADERMYQNKESRQEI